MIASDVETPGKSLFEVLRRRNTVALVVFLIVALSAFAFVKVYKVKYAALSHVVLINDMSGRDPSAAGIDMPTIITASTVLLDVRRQLDLTESINDLRKGVTARIAPKSSLMTISVQDRDPEKAVAIDNAVADSFVKVYGKLAGSRYQDVTRRLDVDVETARVRLGDLERRLETAAAGASYVGSQASLDASASHLGDLEENRGIALAQLVADRANLKADRAQPGKTAKIVRHEILMNNAAYHETERVVGIDIGQYTTTRAGVTDDFPGIAGFKDKTEKENRALDALRTDALTGRDAYSPSMAGQIVQTARDGAAVQGDRTKVAAFDEQIATLKQKLERPSGEVPSIGALRAERDAAEARLQSLSQRLSNAQANAAESSSLGEVVVVDRATEARPTLLGPTFLLALGLIVAMLFAIAAAYLAESLYPRLIGMRDVESVYGRPILATLRSRR